MLDNLAFTQKLDNNYTTASMGHYIKLAKYNTSIYDAANMTYKHLFNLLAGDGSN